MKPMSLKHYAQKRREEALASIGVKLIRPSQVRPIAKVSEIRPAVRKEAA